MKVFEERGHGRPREVKIHGVRSKKRWVERLRATSPRLGVASAATKVAEAHGVADRDALDDFGPVTGTWEIDYIVKHCQRGGHSHRLSRRPILWAGRAAAVESPPLGVPGPSGRYLEGRIPRASEGARPRQCLEPGAR